MTREALKEKSYRLLYKQESARLDIFSRLTRRKPRINLTANIAGEDYEAVRADVKTSKIFLRSSTVRINLIIGSLMPGVMALLFLLMTFCRENLNSTDIWIACFIGGMLLAIALSNLKTLLSNARLEIKATGIMEKDRLYSWENILDTYIVIRSGRVAKYLLVLLMDDGEIVRITLNEFASLQHNAAFDISYYIEHYKRLRTITVLSW